jgi:hypothetical protein
VTDIDASAALVERDLSSQLPGHSAMLVELERSHTAPASFRQLNEIAWRTDVPIGSLNFIPPEWQSAVDTDQTIKRRSSCGPVPSP